MLEVFKGGVSQKDDLGPQMNNVQELDQANTLAPLRQVVGVFVLACK